MQRRRLLAMPAALAGLPAGAQPAAVDLLLVLAVDASGSIDADEFRLQRVGYAEALSHPAVLSAIAGKPQGAIAVTMVEWGAPGGAETVVEWMRLADAASARALAAAVLAAPRSRQSWNAIGDAIDHSAALLRAAPFRAAERVIDLSGDGPDLRSRRPATAARDDAVAAGISINALAVAAAGQVTRYGEALAETYRREVIGGPGAFVVSAEDRRDIARALRAKLVREIA
ncbi:hypothetical protein GCM10011504_21220 [Siccirubricoccus deserti]|uniref:DUF1194 domain-containing protein n=1 Tax=Siccirubricoccus deserti TaxID=2013562 RepID=A0A9X0QXP6_9PROT|nr:DUF1194 domain-containing protein [Siccirubricoccus deserti]MBC4015540.1 DUF1194 domain-containing protein [Siccirubricoccus deserti]GGC42541.1 hypothetical protein GCM10011504_21220 [Siccirubricoccus deserti]